MKIDTVFESENKNNTQISCQKIFLNFSADQCPSNQEKIHQKLTRFFLREKKENFFLKIIKFSEGQEKKGRGRMREEMEEEGGVGEGEGKREKRKLKIEKSTK